MLIRPMQKFIVTYIRLADGELVNVTLLGQRMVSIWLEEYTDKDIQLISVVKE